jgi:hypothetical protein
MKKQTTLVAALVMGLALPAFAQDGFRVGLSVGSMKTTGDTTSLAANQAVGSTNTINQYGYDQPTQTPYGLNLALVRGDDEFTFSFLNAKKSDSRALPTDTANPYSIGVIFGGSYPNVNGTQEQKATLIDLGWTHTFAKGDNGSMAFSMGLRSSSITDEFTSTYANAAGTPQETLHAKGKGRGFGLTTGLHGRMNFNEKFWMTGGFTAALLNNTASTDDYSLQGGGGPAVQFTNDDTHQSLLQTEAYLRFNMTFVKSFNGYLGYEVKDFGHDSAKVENLYTNLGLPTTHGFGLSGFTLGVSYTF